MGENEDIETKGKTEKELIELGICPVCKANLTKKEGCTECTQCGWTMCAEA